MSQLPGASRYLDARVTTASQPELQLMLLEGALRFGRLAEQSWNAPEQRGECSRLLGRALEIVEELIQGVAGGKTAISQRLEEEYAFAFRQLALAQLHHDLPPLQSALRLLAIERETWKLALDKLRPNETQAAATGPPQPPAILRSLGGASPMAGASLSLQG